MPTVATVVLRAALVLLSTPVTLAAALNQQHGQTLTALQPAQQRPAEDVNLCALFTMRYEVPYLLPFIAFNVVAGVNHVYLYEDDVSPTWQTIPLLARLRGAINACSKCTLISMRKVLAGRNITEVVLNGTVQQAALSHCDALASKSSRPGWMASWDLDEVPVLAGDPRTAQGMQDATGFADGNASAAPLANDSVAVTTGEPLPASLPELLASMPAEALGVLVPRYAMLGEPRPASPLGDSASLEYEYATRRISTPAPAPKPIFRLQRNVRIDGPHMLYAEPTHTTRAAAARALERNESVFRYPDGTALPVLGNLSNGFNSSLNASDVFDEAPLLSPDESPDAAYARIGAKLKLYHYDSRSIAECEWKTACAFLESNHAHDTEGGGGWRAEKAKSGFCVAGEDATHEHSSDTEQDVYVDDMRAAMLATPVRDQMTTLFGSNAMLMQDELSSWFARQLNRTTGELVDELVGETQHMWKATLAEEEDGGRFRSADDLAVARGP